MLTARQRVWIEYYARNNPGSKVGVKKAFRYHNGTYNIILELEGGEEHVIKSVRGRRWETDEEAEVRALEEAETVKKIIKQLKA